MIRFGVLSAGLAIMALLSLVLGCQSRDVNRLIGEWELVDPGGIAGRINQDAIEGAAGERQIMVVRFDRQGILATQTHIGQVVREKSGNWRLLAAEAQRTRVAFTLAGESDELEIEWIDNDTIKMVPPNMAGLTMRLTFRRRSR